MNGLNYLLQTNLYLLLFMSFYLLVLRNETFFRQNRFFLNTSIFLSLLIPFINSDWFRDLFITQKIRDAAIMPSQMLYDTVIVGLDEGTSVLSVGDAASGIYLAGVLILSVRFLIRCASLKANLRQIKGSAFSFFNKLVVDKDLPGAPTIIDHEKVHMRQWHSADILFIELAAIVNWFNPVMHLYKKEIRHIHEFIADEEAAELMQSKSDYAMLLFSNTLGVDPHHLSNNFFNKSLLKRRILMLHKTKSRSTGLWKYGFSAPLFILMLILSSATASSEDNVLSIDAKRSISPIEKLSTLTLAEFPIKNTDSDPIAPARSGKPGNLNLADPNDLKKHISQTIKYPSSAREAKAFGYIQVNFLVKNKQIGQVEITKSLHPDLDKEVLNAVSTFNLDLAVPDNDYMLTVMYLDAERSDNGRFTENVPKNLTFAKNHLGHVLALVRKEKVSTTWLSNVTRPNPQTGEQEPVGYDGSAQDKAPEFPGGHKAWAEYLQKNLKYPEEAKSNNIQGRVIAGFIVDKDGSLQDIKVLRGIGGGADEEAVRVLALSPKWIPGAKNGKTVRMALTLPVNFATAPDQSTGTAPKSESDINDFSNIDVLPEFPDGMAGWAKYLQANLKYPEEARKARVTGRVITEFVVEKDGSLSDINVVRGLGSGLDEEALRVLTGSPKWKPGLLEGRPVRVKYTMPIFFQLGSEKDKRP
jgi:TonB family protein